MRGWREWVEESSQRAPRLALLGMVLLAIVAPVLAAVPALQGPGSSGPSDASLTAPPAPNPKPLAAPTSAPPPAPPPSSPPPPPSVTIGPYARLGASGPGIQVLEERLASLSYLAGKVDGVFDRSTLHALIAFQKVEELPRTGVGDAATLARLDQARAPEPKYSDPPDHLEVDIPRQVVFVVRGGRVSAILPTSTGTNKRFTSEGRTRRAITPNGRYQISYKRNGWRKSPLGILYRPAYFNGGIAFHGARSVPTYPASHGCVRLPMPFADWFAESASPVGMVVYVYGGPYGKNPQPTVVDAPASPPAPSAEQPAGSPSEQPPASPPEQPPAPPPEPTSPPPAEPGLPGIPGVRR